MRPCDALADRLDRFDDLDPAQRQLVLHHVSACAGCRARWSAHDPARWFALLSLDQVDAALLDRVSAGVSRDIDGISGSRRAQVRRWAGASLAASVLLAAALGAYLVGGAPLPQGDAEPRLARENGIPEDVPAGRIHLVDSPGEPQVLDLSVGQTQVVMIFDKDLDI